MRGDIMKFYIAKIAKQNGASLDVKVSEKIQSLQDYDDGYVFPGEVKVEGVLTNIGEYINMNVVASTTWETECARCLLPVTGDVEITVDENFRQVRSADEEQQEVDEYTFDGDWLIPDRAIAGAIISSLSFVQVCKENCKGLCPDCGTDLNKNQCSCKENKINPAMEKLKNFKV